MKKVLEILLNNSGAIQLACDIGAKIVLIAVGSIIIGQHIVAQAVARRSPPEVDLEKPIGFRVRK